ncbi:MAG TPA: hypothetical protein VLT45_16910 [Kofleriaceae bacterium]|nr:hypothetical protein [Kofleriaceae bacterium]
MWRRRVLGAGVGVAVAALAGIAFHVARRSAGYWGIDDGGITFGHAIEFADHGSLAAYVEGTPVESYSNPLVFFVVAALRRLGRFDPVTTHHTIEIVLFATMVALVWALLRHLTNEGLAVAGAACFAVLELATPATWLWYGSGLENLWVSTGIVALLWLLVRSARGVAVNAAWGIVPALTALTRPEAPVYAAAFFVALGLVARPRELRLRVHLSRVALALGPMIALYGGFLVWRHARYGDWLPNTYYAKVGSGFHPLVYLRTEVIGSILPYAWSRAFVACALLLAIVRWQRRIGGAVLIMLVASLALPLATGPDFFMGEHRFATPFLAVTHVAFAMFFVWAFGMPGVRTKIAAVACATALPAFLIVDRVRRGPLYLDVVTTTRVAELQGGERWEEQMRAGVPYAVTMEPDVGGAIIVGGVQLVDNAYLAEFVLSHMGRYWGDNPDLLRQVDEYQHEERRPDLVDPATAIGVLDAPYVGTRYLHGPDRHLVRRDLVEAGELPAGAALLCEAAGVRVYVSPENVATVAPRGLARYEVFVEWSGGAPDPALQLRASVAGGDADQISLVPFVTGERGLERRALLLGAPSQTGAAAVSVTIVRGDDVLASANATALDVTRDFAAAAAALADAPPQRFAWLREQAIPRYGLSRLHVIERKMMAEDAARDPRAGRNVMRLRWQARLATFEDLPRVLRDTERRVVHRVVTTACTGSPARIACLGRTVDTLRRLGYLGVVAAEPGLRDELAKARTARATLPPPQRFSVLVGLVLADPADLTLQRELIALRRQLETYPPLP